MDVEDVFINGEECISRNFDKMICAKHHETVVGRGNGKFGVKRGLKSNVAGI